ncbi:PQQ-binding-like beta-propeller repeat protein [Halolamina sp. C58]|uniref:outer membrane protein assembly factor BamB family protein n=1 Tax=Halolamina sp. C58 TaxID=3421640 RepID=UPI003EBD85BD
MPSRRAFLAASAATVGLAGCLSGELPNGELGSVDGEWRMDGHDAGHTRRVDNGPSDPATVWGRELDGVRAAGTPALADGRLYVPADAVSPESRSFHRLYALDASTGETRWWAPSRIDLNGAPGVVGERVVVTGKRSLERGRVLCFGSRYGEEEWLYDVDARLTAPPTVDGGVAYVPDWSGTVHALWVADGSVLWSQQIEDTTQRGSTTFTTPAAVDGETLYVGSNSGATGIVALDIDDGGERWRAETEPVTAGPVVHGDLLVVQSYGLVIAYGTDGEQRWVFNVLDSGNRPIAVDDEHVYATGRETLYAITHDGEESWRYERDGRVGAPTVVGDSVLLTGEGRITALSAATGGERWSVTPGGGGDAVVSPGALFVTGDSGRLLALGE